jgi:hypothetical protein
VPRQERYNTSSDFGEFREERRDGYDQGYEYRPPVRQPSYSPPQVERSKQKAPAPIVPGRGVPQQFQQNDAEDAWIISTLSSMFHAEVVRRERGEYSVRPKSVPYDVGSREFQQGLRALDARGYELSLTDEQGPYGGVGSHNKVAYITRTRK